MSRCRVYNDPLAGSQMVLVTATWESPCCLRQVAVELCFALKLQTSPSSSKRSLSTALFLSSRKNTALIYLTLQITCTSLSPGVLVFCSHVILPSVFQLCTCLWSSSVFYSIFGTRPLSVINVWCSCICKQSQFIREYYSSWVRQACPGTQWQRLLLYKADFKYSHFRRDVLQWHEASRLNRSTALTLSLPHPLTRSLPCTVWASACIPFVLLWQGTASHGLNTNMIISWQSPFIRLLSPW